MGEKTPLRGEKRDVRLNVRLTQDMYDRIEAMAQAHGVAVSAAAAMALGEWVLRKENERNTSNSISDAIAQTFGSLMNQMIEQENSPLMDQMESKIEEDVLAKIQAKK